MTRLMYIGACVFIALFASASVSSAQSKPFTTATTRPTTQPFGAYALAEVRMRDPCILPDKQTNTYYLVGSAGRSVRMPTWLMWRGFGLPSFST